MYWKKVELVCSSSTSSNGSDRTGLIGNRNTASGSGRTGGSEKELPIVQVSTVNTSGSGRTSLIGNRNTTCTSDNASQSCEYY